MLIHYQDIGKGKPLIFIHGMLVNGAMFDELVPFLKDEFRLIVPDLRGHGESRELPGPYTIRQHITDIKKLMSELGLDRAIVLGYSHGGAAAQQLAVEYPDLVVKLILVNTYAYNLATAREKFEAMLMRVLISLFGMPAYARLVGSVGDRHLTPPQQEKIKRMLLATNRRIARDVVTSMMSFDGRKLLSRITCPALVIRGADDTVVPKHHAQMLQQGITGSSYREIKGAGHTLALTHPRELAREIRAFVA